MAVKTGAKNSASTKQAATENAVKAFQSEYGLTADGIVGRDTWNRLQDAYFSTLNSLPDEYRSYSSLLYPGYVITTGQRSCRNSAQIHSPLFLIPAYYKNILYIISPHFSDIHYRD